MVNKLTKKSKSKKQSKRKLKKKSNKKINKKGGVNEIELLTEDEKLDNYLENRTKYEKIKYIENDVELVNIDYNIFKILLLINSFYEIYSKDYENSVNTNNYEETEITNMEKNNITIKTPLKYPIYDKETPITVPRKRNKFNNVEGRSINFTTGGNNDMIQKDIKILAYLDNIHDFDNNSRLGVNYKKDLTMKNAIYNLYTTKLELTKEDIKYFTKNEGITLYKYLEKYPHIREKIAFKVNKHFIKRGIVTIGRKNTSKIRRNNNNNNSGIRDIDNSKYIINNIEIRDFIKQNCILYDSPVSKLEEHDFKINTSIIKIKNNNEMYESPPEKIFDSSTSYNKGICKRKIIEQDENKSINYNKHNLFQLGGEEVVFCKCKNNLHLKNNCNIYNLSNGYSLSQLKYWIIKNIPFFNKPCLKVKNKNLTEKEKLDEIKKLKEKEIKLISVQDKLTIFINKLKTQLPEMKTKINDDESFNLYVALSIKRLGDWGMVERSLLNKSLFITNDTLCSLYAMLRNVNLIFHVPSTYSMKLENIKFDKIQLIDPDYNMCLIGCYYPTENEENYLKQPDEYADTEFLDKIYYFCEDIIDIIEKIKSINSNTEYNFIYNELINLIETIKN